MGLFKKKININAIAEEGDVWFEKEDYLKAIEIWQKGLDSLKKPINLQSEAVWFYTSIADAHFMLGNYEKAYECLINAKSNVSGDGLFNPFILMRLGQCCYELNDENAKEYLLRAYMLAGKEIFESDDEKYFKYIEDII